MPDIPHCFNGTNLHTHGLWVNPSGNGDNVLLSINPQTQFTYEYNIPSDHPSGTFWYHTHRHGSTALQVSSGMAGALIIRGNRLPTPTAHGDIDTLIPTSAIPERVLVMQQIQYACRAPAATPGDLGPIKQDINGRYICDPGDVGGIEGYDQFGPGHLAGIGALHLAQRQGVQPRRSAQGDAGPDRALAHDPCRRARHDQPAVRQGARRQARSRREDAAQRRRHRGVHQGYVRHHACALHADRGRRADAGGGAADRARDLPARLSLRCAGRVSRGRPLLRDRRLGAQRRVSVNALDVGTAAARASSTSRRERRSTTSTTYVNGQAGRAGRGQHARRHQADGGRRSQGGHEVHQLHAAPRHHRRAKWRATARRS